MKYEEYKPIIDEAIVLYVLKGGSIMRLSSAIHEYEFDMDGSLPHDTKERLEDKAVVAIINKEPLPRGVTLKRVTIRDVKRKESA